jgi:hypothetical protein
LILLSKKSLFLLCKDLQGRELKGANWAELQKGLQTFNRRLSNCKNPSQMATFYHSSGGAIARIKRWRDDRPPADEHVAKSGWTQSREARAVDWQKRKGARSSSEALADCKGEKGGAQHLREHQEKCSKLSKALNLSGNCQYLTINNRVLLCFVFALQKALFRLCTSRNATIGPSQRKGKFEFACLA